MEDIRCNAGYVYSVINKACIKLRRIIRIQKFKAVCIICLLEFVISLGFSIIAPFFPREAESKQVSQFWIGAIFGVFQGIQFFIAPIFGLYMYSIGIKRLYLVGILISAISTLVFGFTPYLTLKSGQLYFTYYGLNSSKETFLDNSSHSQTFYSEILTNLTYNSSITIKQSTHLQQSVHCNAFIAISFILRLIQGIGCAAYMTTSYVLTVELYPSKMGTIIGIIETCSGLGYALGPPIGSYLYLLGGYNLPFTITGFFLLVLLAFAWYFIPNNLIMPSSYNFNIDHIPTPNTNAILKNCVSTNVCTNQPNTKTWNNEKTPLLSLQLNSNVNFGDTFCGDIRQNNGSLNHNQYTKTEININSIDVLPTNWLKTRLKRLISPMKFFHLFSIHYSLGLNYAILFVGTCTLSFVEVTLEPHIRYISNHWTPQTYGDNDGIGNNVFLFMFNSLNGTPSHNANANINENGNIDITHNNINYTAIGGIFFLLSVSYTLFSLLFGALSDHLSNIGSINATEYYSPNMAIKSPFKPIRTILLFSCFTNALALLISGIPTYPDITEYFTHSSDNNYNYDEKRVIIQNFTWSSMLYSIWFWVKENGVIPQSLGRTASLLSITLALILFGLSFAIQIVLIFTDIMKRVNYELMIEQKRTCPPQYHEALEYNFGVQNGSISQKGKNNNSPQQTFKSYDTFLNHNIDKTDEYFTNVLSERRSLVSGLFSSGIAIGSFVGPLLAGALTGQGTQHYALAANILASMNVAILILGVCVTFLYGV